MNIELNKIRRTRSIGFRLSLLVAFAIVLFGTFGVYFTMIRQETDYKNEKLRQWNLLMDSLAPNLVNLMASNDLDAIRGILDNILSEKEEIHYVFLTDEFDKIIYSTETKLEGRKLPWERIEVLSQPLGRDPVENIAVARFVRKIETGTSRLGALYMGFTYLPFLEKERLTSVLTLENAIKGSVKKYLMEMEFYQVDFLAKEMIKKIRDVAYFKVLSSDGIIISSSNEKEILQPSSGDYEKQIMAEASIRRPVWTRKLNLDGKPILDVTLMIFEDKNIIGMIQVGYDISSLEASRRRGRMILAASAFAALVLALVVAMSIAASISRPVAGLSKAAVQVGGGNLDIKPLAESGGDELRLLVRSFNRMIEGLREKEILKEKKLKVDFELHTARGIQMSLLPQKDPDLKGYVISGANQPALEVSGDYFDFFSIDDHNLGVVIADVIGKGVPAALVTTMVRTLIRSESAKGDTLANVMINANKLTFEDISAMGFVTMIFAAIDSKNHELRYVNSGHNPGIFIKPGGEVELLHSSAPPLGADVDKAYREMVEESRVFIPEGGTVVLYTDGVVEAVDSGDNEFAIERLRDVLVRNRNLRGQSLIRAVLDAVDAYTAGHHAGDDITMVVISRLEKEEISAS